ncbi:MAG: AMP-binding protein [Solirubrobacteraceae bacterium]|nr:AMP-binding protein [Solirubrobacteraceae bacterium]
MTVGRPRIDVVGSADVPTWPEAIAAEYRARGYWTGQTFSDLLRERAAAHPDREAVVGADERLTYAELDRRASALAGGLAWIGVHRGDRVVVQLPNEAVFVEVLFACFRLGAIPILALPAHRASELTHFAAHSEAVAIITSDARSRFSFAGLADEVRAAVPSVREVVVAGEPLEDQRSLDELRGATPLPELAAKSGPFGRDLALLQLSGGTTGASKLIPRTHDDYLYSVRASAQICEQDGDSRYLVVLPAGHNFPLSSAGILGTIESGGTVVMCPSPDPATALGLIETERITVTGLVPPLAIAWLEALSGSSRDVSSLRLLQVGGAKLDAEVARRVEPAFGCRLQQVFGMAEGLVNYTRPEDPLETVIATQGRPMSPADEVRVVDEHDRDVAPGESGALLTRGPYTIRGYYRATEHNRTAFTSDGFYRTGDLVRQAPSGHLEVVGRAKEQINRGGEKVAPAEVEGHLLAHPSVLDACVVGVPDAALGERTYAVVVARGEQPTPASLRKFVRERGVAAFKVPDRITFVPEFPTTGVGKVSRRELRTLLAAQLTDASAASAAATPVSSAPTTDDSGR